MGKIKVDYKNIMKKEITNRDLSTQVAVIANDVAYIKEEVRDIKALVQQDYVTKDEFNPVKSIVYGLVSLILLSVVGALVALVLKK
jgi:hypothetical protein